MTPENIVADLDRWLCASRAQCYLLEILRDHWSARAKTESSPTDMASLIEKCTCNVTQPEQSKTRHEQTKIKSRARMDSYPAGGC